MSRTYRNNRIDIKEDLQILTNSVRIKHYYSEWLNNKKMLPYRIEKNVRFHVHSREDAFSILHNLTRKTTRRSMKKTLRQKQKLEIKTIINDFNE